MNADIRSRLQATLGSAYTLERELGGGGMSRVFVANETAFDRRVVVKVLPPELAAGVNVDRFKREIQVAARLQHPHIVPVLSAGETDGLPFYTMPFVEGSSLRARLAQGPLPITEAVGLLREVARALAYAHDHGVVHRDIKPDNVLLTGGSAVVADFGIAKALSASRVEGPASATLTALGTSLGTPAYMSPEQASGDPSTNHRADLYAFGCMAYEMLTGAPPFDGRTPHKLMAAHMGERPVPVGERRADTPPALAELVMRCLEKEPDDRPQNAADVVRVLESVTSSGTQPMMPEVLLGGRGMLRRALLTYAVAFVAVMVLAKAAIIGIGLPEWVFTGAVVVMALGLPVILFTAYVQRMTHRALTATPTLTPGGSTAAQGTMATIAVKAAPHVSWRRATLGGVWAVGGFVALIAGWMVLRALGIGPAGSLIAAGKIADGERVILADFRGSADSALRFTVTEAFRADLSQSRSLVPMPASAVRETLRRMQRAPSLAVDYALAREIATREGIKAVIEGEVLAVGNSHLLSVRLVASQTGEQLATLTETADGLDDVIPAISRLTRKLRTRTGESLRRIASARTLDKVTTGSLEALEKYMSAIRSIEADEGGFERGMQLLEEAVAIDSGFAMAYRKMAAELNNRALDPERRRAVIQKAYDHRDRLSDAERLLTIAAYHTFGPAPDGTKALAAYQDLLQRDPDNTTALNNAAVHLLEVRDWARAESLVQRAVTIQPTSSVYYTNLTWARLNQGKLREAEEAVRLGIANVPRSASLTSFAAVRVALARGDVDEAIRLADSVRAGRASDPDALRDALFVLEGTALMQGRLADAGRYRAGVRDAGLRMSAVEAPLTAAIGDAMVDVWYRGDAARARRRIDQALGERPLGSLEPDLRPYNNLALVHALTGRPDHARATLAGLDSTRSGREPRLFAAAQRELRGTVAFAEARYLDAANEYRAVDAGFCVSCLDALTARAYDLAGESDSTIAVLRRFLDNPAREPGFDAWFLAPSHKRLGELYEAKGDRENARVHYARFVALWARADAELQPQVRQVQQRLAALERAER